MGNVVSAGLGQNPARQAALKADCPSCPPRHDQQGVRIGFEGRQCSPIRRSASATSTLRWPVAWSRWSNCPYLLPRVRGDCDSATVKCRLHDQRRLWCAFEQYHMGNAGEVVAEHYNVDAKRRTPTRTQPSEGRAGHRRKAAFDERPADLDSSEEGRPGHRDRGRSDPRGHAESR